MNANRWLVTALITGVTLLVTINSLVLSQELGAVEDQRGRLKGATDFREAVSDSRDEELRERVDDFVDNLATHADSIREDLKEAQFGTYDVVKAALDYNYSWKIFRARRIKNAHVDSFDDEANDAYEMLLESRRRDRLGIGVIRTAVPMYWRYRRTGSVVPELTDSSPYERGLET